MPLTIRMGEEILYKYLTYDGGLKMLQNSNLQFTNATKFNDPFDCHPTLYNYNNPPEKESQWYGADFLEMKGKTDMENHRNNTWICCFSKVYDSLLMWAYYNAHKGICIGLNQDAVLESCNKGYFGTFFPFFEEVQYKDILDKSDFFKDNMAWFNILATKAKDWEHEQEVRIIAEGPAWVNAVRDVPQEFREEEIIDGKEVRYYPKLSADCFESIYLGLNIFHRNKEDIVRAAKKLNPNIKIYQMTIDSEAFKLKEVEI